METCATFRLVDSFVGVSQPASLSRLALCYSIHCQWPVRRRFILRLISVGPSAKACTVPSISQPLRGGFSDSLLVGPSVVALHLLLVGPSMVPLYCTLSISRPLRGLCTALSIISRPLRGGFVLYFLSRRPSVEASYCGFYQSGPSVEALYALYQSALPWRLCTALYTSRPLRGGFVL